VVLCCFCCFLQLLPLHSARLCTSLNVLHCSRWFGSIWLFSMSTICGNFVEVFCFKWCLFVGLVPLNSANAVLNSFDIDCIVCLLFSLCLLSDPRSTLLVDWLRAAFVFLLYLCFLLHCFDYHLIGLMPLVEFF
jgi:hypothetical protein